MRLRSARIVTPDGVVAGEVVVSGGCVESVAPVGGGGGVGAGVGGDGRGDLVDLGSRWLVPGFIDVHVHGGGGAQCNTTDPGEVAAVARFHAGHGTTALLATTVAAGADELVGALRAIRGAMGVPGGAGGASGAGGARILGAHLEGPFLAPGSPGAMDPACFVAPDAELWRRLTLAGDGCVALMTLAPELPGAPLLVAELVEAGVVVSLGHSGCGAEDARGAIAAGARSATHVFDAMGPLHHRAPGLVGTVLDDPRVSCELICDGVHVDPVIARLVHRCKGDAGIHLVTDAIAAAGMPDGDYRLGAAAVSVAGGVARGASGKLAGSTLTMDAAVAGAVRWLGVDVPAAVEMASANPAALLGLEHRCGAIAAGFDADLAVLDEDLAACGTMVAGEWVGGPPEWAVGPPG